METIISFLTDGAKRGDLLRWVQSQESKGKCDKLIKLCQTRFVERHVAVAHFCEQLPAVSQALQLIATWNDSRSSSKASLLYHAISSTEFLVGLVVADRLAGVLRPLALALQEKGADLPKALDMVDAVSTALQELRTDRDAFSQLMAKVESLAEELGVEIKEPRLVERSRNCDC